ncbi:acylphosphatase [Weissella coleopterorum]|uniref:acylphosphatase n=1 Tax=Weissella coleopterorum TaxID=2714949 RepID=A0A6G8AY90_9LACO|nr:acylphosphatase [Weissella coleopterorum]QIL50024.1 acylphosphatase [Weissella coleopterorum]
MEQAIRMKVYGLVQGVGFRWATRRLADQLGIVGFVINENDGSVLVEAQGEEFNLRKFITQIEIGPSNGTKVHHVKIASVGLNPDYTTFKIY